MLLDRIESVRTIFQRLHDESPAIDTDRADMASYGDIDQFNKRGGLNGMIQSWCKINFYKTGPATFPDGLELDGPFGSRRFTHASHNTENHSSTQIHHRRIGGGADDFLEALPIGITADGNQIKLVG